MIEDGFPAKVTHKISASPGQSIMGVGNNLIKEVVQMVSALPIITTSGDYIITLTVEKDE